LGRRRSAACAAASPKRAEKWGSTFDHHSKRSCSTKANSPRLRHDGFDGRGKSWGDRRTTLSTPRGRFGSHSKHIAARHGLRRNLERGGRHARYFAPSAGSRRATVARLKETKSRVEKLSEDDARRLANIKKGRDHEYGITCAAAPRISSCATCPGFHTCVGLRPPPLHRRVHGTMSRHRAQHGCVQFAPDDTRVTSSCGRSAGGRRWHGTMGSGQGEGRRFRTSRIGADASERLNRRSARRESRTRRKRCRVRQAAPTSGPIGATPGSVLLTWAIAVVVSERRSVAIAKQPNRALGRPTARAAQPEHGAMPARPRAGLFPGDMALVEGRYCSDVPPRLQTLARLREPAVRAWPSIPPLALRGQQTRRNALLIDRLEDTPPGAKLAAKPGQIRHRQARLREPRQEHLHRTGVWDVRLGEGEDMCRLPGYGYERKASCNQDPHEPVSRRNHI